MSIHPKRLIEVDLPIARISAHARREKSIRHGHISTLHIWWARRPLAACRAVICAALWPDPQDLARFATGAGSTGDADRAATGANAAATIRPARFLDEARARMTEWATRHYAKASEASHARLMAIGKNPGLLDDPVELRAVLLDFIADFADWDHSTDRDYLATARALTQAAHEALGGEPGTRPLVVDPFAGGGSIPLEALRVGADAFASDLNPIPVLLNKVVLEYIPKYGNAEVTMPDADGKPRTFLGLADAVRYWGGWIKEQAERELAAFYPPDPPDKKNDIPAATPIAYLWARTILSEAPGQGHGEIPVEVPLMRSLWLAKKAGRRRALRWLRDEKGRVKTQTVEVTYATRGTGFQPVIQPASESTLHPQIHGLEARATKLVQFNPREVSIRYSAYLPHWEQEGATYSVTFRLDDSLPREVLEGWLRERQEILLRAEADGRSLSETEQRRLRDLHSERVEKYLDTGHGACHLKDARAAEIMSEALRHFDGQRYDLIAWCVMPNHVHVVVRPRPGEELSKITHSWKSFTSNEINKTLGRKGTLWQADSFDHLIRDADDLERSIQYVLDNPRAARLQDWLWSGCGTGFQPVNHGQPQSHGLEGRATMRVKRPLLEIFEPTKDSEVEGGTVARGSATCPVTGFTTKVDSVRAQLKKRRGGAADARLFCIVTTREDEQGRFYRLPTKADQAAFDAAAAEMERRTADPTQASAPGLSVIPDEPLPPPGGLGFRVQPYGMTIWSHLFTPRQLLALTTLARLVREAGARMRSGTGFQPVCGSAGHGQDAWQDARATGSEGAESAALQSTGSTPETDGSKLQASRSVLQADRSVLQAARTHTQATGSGLQTAGTQADAAHGGQNPNPGGQGTADSHAGTTAAKAETAFSVPPGGFSAPDGSPGTADAAQGLPNEFADAVQACLALCVDKIADLGNAFCPWEPVAECPRNLFARQAIPMGWNFGEGVAIGESSGSFAIMVERFEHVLGEIGNDWSTGNIQPASATQHPLPDDAADAFVTDPPYYDAVPYSDLSDFFYVWLKRMLPSALLPAFADTLTPKDAECIVDDAKGKDGAFFETCMTSAMAEGRRVARPSGIGVVVFAHKSTAGWETQLAAMIEAGWIITGSWPIDTEMESRFRARDSAALASSVHIVMRPREHAGGERGTGFQPVSHGQDAHATVGDWRDVLAELPRRMHEWMPRLAAEGVVGADAIFACLGPALEVFSRYSRVEKASGEVVTLGEYLEQVWAAVSKEALSLLFSEGGKAGDADAAGLEPDARLTAMWLWTLGGGKPHASGRGDQADGDGDDADDDDGEDGGAKKAAPGGGFVLEFDAARKIAQGLGAHLEKLPTVVEVKGDKARLLSVAERTKYLFGKDAEAGSAKARPKRSKPKQGSLFEELDAAEASSAAKWGVSGPTAGSTVLDRVHQAMILFAAGRGEALRRFLVDDGAGKSASFWKLAQSLSALYPAGTEEKRWVDGVLGRKKGLGL